jgi:predicted DNA-binding transcriptional regulator YafY
MPDETLKKLDRIVAILIQLQSGKVVKAQDMARRFEVSQRTIYRDIRTLEASGVPVYGEAGSGYSLMEGYRLPPVMFTREEAESFIAAEKLMQQFTDKELGRHYQSAAFKLRAVLHSFDKIRMNQLESNILIQPPSGKLFNERLPDTLAVLFRSIADKTQVELTYKTFDSEEVTSRKVEPVGVFHDNNQWYIMGYCHLRKDYRQFRTDRIQNIKNSILEFTIDHNPLDHYLKSKKEHATTPVKIRVDKSIAKYVNYDRKYHGFVSEAEIGGQIEMNFMSPSVNDGFARWFLMFADYAEIIEPLALKDRILELMDTYRKKLQKSPE